MSILKQSKPRFWVGGAKEVLTRIAMYFGLINFVLIAPTAYAILSPYIKDAVPWMSFPVFIVFWLAVIGVLFFLEYKLVMPSTLAFLNKQEYSHKSLLREDHEAIIKRLEKIEEALGVKKEDDGTMPDN